MKEKDIAVKFPGIYIIHQKMSGYELNEHKHKEHEFFMPLQGEIQIQAAEKKLKAGVGKMIYLPPETPHSFHSNPTLKGERLILIIENNYWNTCSEKTFSSMVIPSSQLCKEIMFQLLIYPKTKASKGLAETMVQTLSEMLEGSALIGTSDPFHFFGKSKDSRLKKALSIIEEDFNSNLSTSEIAVKSGLSLRNLNRLFITELGMTPKQVITYFRIEYAKKLLLKGSSSVTDIALEVGYSSLSQFITVFRKITGQIPSSLRPLK